MNDPDLISTTTYGFASQSMFLHLGLALAVGLIVGLERDWQHREKPEAQIQAGIRTFALLGMLGGISALLARIYGPLVFLVGFASITLLLLAVRMRTSPNGHEFRTSNQLACLMTFALGALAMQPEAESAAAALAVITAVLLSLKHYLKGWLQTLSVQEMRAALWLLVISVVALPILPNEWYGPWQAFNPQRFWWMVVLISGLSFAGYFAMKLAGVEKGILLTGLIGGLVSSTALTLHFSRLGREGGPAGLLAAGVLIASGTMFFRVVAIVAALERELATALAWPMFVTGGLVYLCAALLWYMQNGRAAEESFERPSNPLNVKTALKFAALLAAVLVLSKAGHAFFGERGVYAVAFASGLTDVDAITLSMTQMAQRELAVSTALWAILLACATNTVVKALLVLALAGQPMGWRVLVPLVLALGAGSAILVWRV